MTRGQKMALFRKRRHMTQRDLADLVGCSAAAICHAELSKHEFRVSRALRWAEAVGIEDFETFRRIFSTREHY